MRPLGVLSVFALLCTLPSIALARSDGIRSLDCSGCHGSGDYSLALRFDPTDFVHRDAVALTIDVNGASNASRPNV
ncbi:MAG: hypothetical protein AAF658_16425 [Myxococcota bacterium]